jgi:mannose-1-phosphate guanylyltransferase
LIATLGVENIVVAQTEDIILVCDKTRAQDIKLIPETLAASGKDSYC